jgi:hypothetical protein
MRGPFCFPLLLAVFCGPLLAQSDTVPILGEVPGNRITVLHSRVLIPPRELRRVSLAELPKGAELFVEYRAEVPGRQIQLEVLRRDGVGEGNRAFRNLRRLPLDSQGTLRYSVESEGDYIVALRQAEGAKSPLHVELRVELSQGAVAPRPQIQTLSHEKRLAVAIFSLGFLWTTVVLCGVPILRAFRSRRKREVHPWYG